MNVLAAPFLASFLILSYLHESFLTDLYFPILCSYQYILPTEIEAFYCFSHFIEECCPLYVSPTLAGVHKGLKVRSFLL